MVTISPWLPMCSSPQGHLLKARDSIEMVLADIGRNSYLSLCVEMCWSILQHVLFQVRREGGVGDSQKGGREGREEWEKGGRKEVCC